MPYKSSPVQVSKDVLTNLPKLMTHGFAAEHRPSAMHSCAALQSITRVVLLGSVQQVTGKVKNNIKQVGNWPIDRTSSKVDVGLDPGCYGSTLGTAGCCTVADTSPGIGHCRCTGQALNIGNVWLQACKTRAAFLTGLGSITQGATTNTNTGVNPRFAGAQLGARSFVTCVCRCLAVRGIVARTHWETGVYSKPWHEGALW